MRVLITGAGGFLGSHLISFLKQNPETNFKIFNLGKNKTKNSELLFLDDVKNKIDINRYIGGMGGNGLPPQWETRKRRDGRISIA